MDDYESDEEDSDYDYDEDEDGEEEEDDGPIAIVVNVRRRIKPHTMQSLTAFPDSGHLLPADAVIADMIAPGDTVKLLDQPDPTTKWTVDLLCRNRCRVLQQDPQTGEVAMAEPTGGAKKSRPVAKRLVKLREIDPASVDAVTKLERMQERQVRTHYIHGGRMMALHRSTSIEWQCHAAGPRRQPPLWWVGTFAAVTCTHLSVCPIPCPQTPCLTLAAAAAATVAAAAWSGGWGLWHRRQSLLSAGRTAPVAPPTGLAGSRW